MLADVVAPRKRTTSSDRLIAGFQGILDFYEKEGRLPEDTEAERSLFHKWKGILKKEASIERCRPFDRFGILPNKNVTYIEPAIDSQRELTQEEQLEAILADPLLADIQNGEDLGIFDIPDFMKERLKARKEAEYVGKRVPCEDFDKFEKSFKEIHEGLKNGKYRLEKFSVKNLKVGNFFVEDGMIGYLAAFDDEGINKHGDRDGRTRVVYENGTESDIKYKTITKNLSVTGYSVVNCGDFTKEEEDMMFSVNDKDVESGIIYVLRSKSTKNEIASIKDLYKIGFSTTSLESRIANAKNEPTYLCADVEVVATWKVYNVKSSTFEALIHKLFASAQLQISVDGHRPKEWYVVPLNIIEQAVKGIINGEPMTYDANLMQLIFSHNKQAMKCLSLKQPWATLICMGIKDVENRSWRPKEAPGRILIHAGATMDKYAQSEAEDIIGHELPKLPKGAIIGSVEVYGFVEHSESVWAGEGQGSEWKWLLRDAKMFKKPIPYKGKLGLFTVSGIEVENL